MTSRSDAGLASPAQRRVHAWSPVELEKLESLAGNLPLPELIKSYNSWAVRQRPPLPRRSRRAIRGKAVKHKISLKCFGDSITITSTAAILGISPARVRRWINRKLIPVRWNYHCYINRSDLVKMAWQHPQELHSIARDRLYDLLEMEDVVDHVLTHGSRIPGPHKPRPVRCVETGFWWPSIRAASQAVFIDPANIRKAIRHGRTAANRHWEWAS